MVILFPGSSIKHFSRKSLSWWTLRRWASSRVWVPTRVTRISRGGNELITVTFSCRVIEYNITQCTCTVLQYVCIRFYPCTCTCDLAWEWDVEIRMMLNHKGYCVKSPSYWLWNTMCVCTTIHSWNWYIKLRLNWFTHSPAQWPCPPQCTGSWRKNQNGCLWTCPS